MPTFKLEKDKDDNSKEVCVPAGCNKGQFWDNGRKICRECGEGCDDCEDIMSCKSCKDTSVQCQGGFRYNSKATSKNGCEPCTVKGCEKCETSDTTCDKCYNGYDISSDKKACTVKTNSTLGPCPDGYYKDKDYKCQACTPGCKYCTDDKNCFQCMDGVEWKTSTRQTCNFDCDITCKDGVNGVFKCDPQVEGKDKVTPLACMIGYQYNGFSI